MNAVEPLIKHAVDVELAAARRDHAEFHSLHEGYAVTLEEVEEAHLEMATIEDLMRGIWSRVRSDNAEMAADLYRDVELTAVRLATEAIQVAAMAKKAYQGIPCYKIDANEMYHIGDRTKTWFGKE